MGLFFIGLLILVLGISLSCGIKVGIIVFGIGVIILAMSRAINKGLDDE